MIRLLCFSCLLLLLAGCKKKEDPKPEPEPPPPPPTESTMSGNIYHYDQFGQLYTSQLAGANAKIESNGRQAQSNDKGRYSIEKVSAGTYTLVFTKNGCGLTKSKIVFKVGDTLSFNGEVADKPSFVINDAYVKDTTWFNQAGVYYKARTAETNTTASAVGIVSKSKTASLADPESYLNYAPASIINKPDYNRFLSYSFLKTSYQLQSNDTIYVKIYPVATKAAGYIEGKLSKPVYTAYGPAYASTFSLVIP